jgi:TolB-like protein
MVGIIFRYIMAGCLLMALTGCFAGHGDAYRNVYPSDRLTRANYEMADMLENNLKHSISPNQPILVASFVNVNRLEQSSTFGHIISEQIASRFAQRGYKIIEMKLRQNSVFIKEGKGEFLLSRDVREISKAYDSAAVIVGTYAEGYNKLYVSARIVSVSDSEVISSFDYAIPMDAKAISVLLRDS